MPSAGLQALLDQTSEESLNLALEALKAAVNADLHPKGSEAALSRQVLQLWAQHVADPLLSEGCKDVIEAWAANADSLPDLLVGSLRSSSLPCDRHCGQSAARAVVKVSACRPESLTDGLAHRISRATAL